MENFQVTNEMQFYLRVLSVFIGVLLNGMWYRNNYSDKKNMFLVLIVVALYIGLFTNV